MLKLAASPVLAILSLIFGSGLENQLIESLFLVQKKKKASEDQNNLAEIIRKRKPIKIRVLNWIFDRGNLKQSQIAASRIEDELDIVNLLRHLFVSRVSMKILFRRVERYLLEQQAMPFVITDDADRLLIDDFKDFNVKFPPMTHKHSNYNRLVRGVQESGKQQKLEGHESRQHLQ